MRLVNARTLKLEEFLDETQIRYIILSHRWEGEEVTKQEFERASPADVAKTGYQKVKKFCALAVDNGHQYVWVDTCCIDKTSSAELSEAINSMYRWYADAVMCFAYLSDVPHGANGVNLKAFEASKWFTRGWTLQELLAPSDMIFLDQAWDVMGSREDLTAPITRVTKIPDKLLKGETQIEDYSIAQRMSWASNRVTTRAEDIAYCLLGLFNVNMPMLYGEGHRAFIRLQMNIIQQEHDHSIFAWQTRTDIDGGLLAQHPSMFAECSHIVGFGTEPGIKYTPRDYNAMPLTITSRGIDLTLLRCLAETDTYYVTLDCVDLGHPTRAQVHIALDRTKQADQYARAHGGIIFEDSRGFPHAAQQSYAHFRVPQPLTQRRRERYKSLKDGISVTFAHRGSHPKPGTSDSKFKVSSTCAPAGGLWQLDMKSEHGNTFDARIGELHIRVVITFGREFDMICLVHVTKDIGNLEIDHQPGSPRISMSGPVAFYGIPGRLTPTVAPPPMPVTLKGETSHNEEAFCKAFWVFAADRLLGCTAHLMMGHPLESAGTITISRPENTVGELVWNVHVNDIRSEAIERRLDAQPFWPLAIRSQLEAAGIL